jgi:Kef-type K+ transport system membrane component KefB
MHLFTELSILLAIAAGIAILMRALRQPLIIGYIVTGIIAGPTFLGLIHDATAFSALGSLGVAILLFIIGLDLNTKIISRLGKVVFLVTLAQMGVITWAGFLTARLLDFGKLESAVIGLGLAMSSTIIIVKLLNDKKETTRLYAQITIGILILQDFVATAGKIGLAAKAEGGSADDIVFLLGRGVAVTALLFVASRHVIPRFTRALESSKELLLLFSLGWALGIASLFEAVGFSIEIGALFAGISLASLPYSNEMASRLKPLRDFFLVIFFITLGQAMAPGKMMDSLGLALIFSFIVLVIKPLLVLVTMGLLGYTKRASFKTGVSLSQISEFSLVFVSAAVATGLVREQAATTITLVALITFAASTYLIKYDDILYRQLEHHLRFFERKVTKIEQHEAINSYPIVMFGYNKGGHEFRKTFKNMQKKFVVVDYDPDVIDSLEQQQIPYLYGDAVDPELLEEVHLDKSKLVVSTISDHKTNMFLAHWLGKHNPHAVFVCSADSAEHASDLYADGTSYVMIPHYIGSEKLSAFIKKNGFSKGEFKKYREKHLTYLQSHYDEAVDSTS